MLPAEHEQLVAFLGRQFTEIDRRFDQVADRFDQIDRRFDQVDSQIAELRHEMLGHFDATYRRLDRLEQEYHAITQALRRIEAGLADESGRREILVRDLAELKHQVAALQSRVADIEQRLGR
jgi:chromosome segregation ATPase